MKKQKGMYNVTFKTISGIRTRLIEADNMWQAREKIKQSYVQSQIKGELKIISVVKVT